MWIEIPGRKEMVNLDRVEHVCLTEEKKRNHEKLHINFIDDSSVIVTGEDARLVYDCIFSLTSCRKWVGGDKS